MRGGGVRSPVYDRVNTLALWKTLKHDAGGRGAGVYFPGNHIIYIQSALTAFVRHAEKQRRLVRWRNNKALKANHIILFGLKTNIFCSIPNVRGWHSEKEGSND